ncbi:MAG: Stf0 family sulphotransferase [Chloroflexota bacterium]
MKPRLSYLISGTARSGTSLLCDGLSCSGVAGRPEEYFDNGTTFPWGVPSSPHTFSQYLAATFAATMTPNGVFGAKVFWPYLVQTILPGARAVAASNDMSDSELLECVFPNLHYIYLRRDDRLRQAISYERARQTRIWAADQGTARESLRKVEFDYLRIHWRLQEIEIEEQNWRRLFQEAGVHPLELTYENIVAAPVAALHAVLEYLKIPVTEDFIFVPQRQKQADDITEAWVKLYNDIDSTIQFVNAEESDMVPITFRNKDGSRLPNGAG